MIRYFFILVTFFVLIGCENSNEKVDPNKKLSLSTAMGDTKYEDFEKAIKQKIFIFPKDHGPHPEFKTEWWYFTGNLVSEDGKEFGYQFTIFRTALSKNKNNRRSEWNSNQIYMAHFAVTDISQNKFYFQERFSRDGNELAGAQINPLKIWLEDWQVAQLSNKYIFDLPVLNIKVKTEKVGINFILESTKPMVLQGDNGLSQKGKQIGNASYYYSYTRLKTFGQIVIKGKEFNVNGFSWMDREWSTSALSGDQKGWDWFALQLDDNTEIMYYQMRKSDGSPDIFSKGVVVNQNGTSELIKKEVVALNITENWESSNGTIYPSGWNLKIPSKNIDLNISPAIKNQYMDITIKYWEGAVKVGGIKNGSPITGRGYVELTGY